MLTLRKKFWPPSSSGLGRRPLTAVAWVRIPSGVPPLPARAAETAGRSQQGGDSRSRRSFDQYVFTVGGPVRPRRPAGPPPIERPADALSDRSAPTPIQPR